MFVIGKVLKPQGIKGEIKAKIITSFPEHFDELSEVYTNKSGSEVYNIENTRFAKGFVFIKFSGIQSRNDAELLRNKYLYIPESDLYPLEDDEFYYHQLIGADVFSENDDQIGKIVDIETYPGNDLLVVKDKSGQSHLIPIINDIVKKVDVKSQKVIIHLMEGLLE